MIDTLYATALRHHDKIDIVFGSRDLLKTVQKKKLAAMIGVEGGHMIENDLKNLDKLYNRGARYMTLTWNNSTPWATSALKEGVMENPKVDVVFGLHINSQTEVGKITYRPGGTMAGVNDMKITVKGRQAHGAYPWSSIDPIVVSAQIINNLQTIVSRNLNVTENAGVVTIGSIHGGNRSNIIPEQVEMLGTIRALSTDDEKMLIERIRQIVTKTAEANGATADVKIPYTSHYPVTFNDVALTEKMLPTLRATAGTENVLLKPAVTGAEDFSFFQQKAPGLFFFLGGMPKGKDPKTAPSHHTPDFYLDESGFKLGVKALTNLVLDYMSMAKK
jgi:amidohydrolase